MTYSDRGRRSPSRGSAGARVPGGAAFDAAIELLYFAYRGFVAGPDRLLAARGLGRAHHRILFFAARLERPTVGDLLRTLVVSKQALNGPLRELRAQRLVDVERDPDDARVRRLRLTAEGRRLEARLTRLQRRTLAGVFAAGSAAERDGWEATMRRLAGPELDRSGRSLD